MKKILALILALGIAPAFASAEVPRYCRPLLVRPLVRCHHMHDWHRDGYRRHDGYR